MPVKKPDDPNKAKDLSCPFCGSGKSIKKDWSKVWSVVGKR